MNIIIPLGGKGERFSKEGYVHPKPLIPIFEKNMIDYVLNNLTISINDKVFIIYNNNLDNYNFSTIIREKYPYIHLININDTKGAVETLFIGIQFIIANYEYNYKCMLLDCDTFYTEDIIGMFRNSSDNMVFYTKNDDINPVYSYIELNNESTIINIKEKHKISDNANTGAYAFTDIKILYEYCKYVLDNNITFNNEPYTSCVISEMIRSNYIFKGYELTANYVFSLGTPKAVEKYIDNTFAFLFDLDGTLVVTDDIYYDVWKQILINYNITLTKEIFEQFIQGNNDKYVINSLLKNIDISLTELSELKDSLFIDNIHKLKIIDGIYVIINQIKLAGYKICIVTNCNKNVAKKIVDIICIEDKIDFIISSDDCLYGKPNSEPYKKAIKKYNIDNQKCFIFEDSKSGLLSGKGVEPNLLIGIETIYDSNELLKYGVDLSVKNYLQININDLINNENKYKQFLINMIKNCTTIRDVAQIDLSNQYLKGGFIADVVGFKIITNNNTVYSLILKYENDKENDLSLMAKKLCLYEREYYFYTDISSKININIPIFFNLIKNDKFNNCGVVLENLIEKKYKINLNLNLESIDVTLKIIDRMACMHSFFWNKNLNQMFPKLKGSTDEIFSPFLSEFINERREKFTNKWYHILNKFQISKCDEIFNNFDNIQKRFSIGDNLTFIHGDIKSPNIFYDVENNYEPYFIDWQHCAIGKGVQDLIFFIIESFNINNINSIFYLTKYYYYMKLQEFGITNYSFEEYENDIYDAICYIPFFTGVWFGTTPHDELIDKNFPYFLISKMFYLIEIISK